MESNQQLVEAVERHRADLFRLIFKWAIVIGSGLAVYLAPMPQGIAPESWRLLAIFVATIVGSIVRPVPSGAMVLMGIAAIAITRSMPISEAVARTVTDPKALETLRLKSTLAGYADPVVWLVLAAFFFSTVMSTVQGWAARLQVQTPAFFWTTSQALISPAVNVLAFTLVYRWLPKARVPWRDALHGAVIVAAAWELGRHVLAAILIGTHYSTAYGIVGAFISFAQVPWTVRGYPVLGLLGTAGAAALFGAAFTWYLFGNRFGKISLRRLLPGKARAGR